MNRPLAITPSLLTSLLALLVGLLVLLVYVPGLIGAAVKPAARGEDPSDVVAQLMEDHDREFEQYRERFLGRSFFFTPPAPPRPAPPPRPVVKRDPPPRVDPQPVETGPPPPPPDYTGPSVIMVIGNEVWFKPMLADENTMRVRVGEERNGLRVLEANPPWSVRLGHKGGEYDVSIFEKRGIEVLEGGGESTATPKGIEVRTAEGDETAKTLVKRGDGLQAAPLVNTSRGRTAGKNDRGRPPKASASVPRAVDERGEEDDPDLEEEEVEEDPDEVPDEEYDEEEYDEEEDPEADPDLEDEDGEGEGEDDDGEDPGSEAQAAAEQSEEELDGGTRGDSVAGGDDEDEDEDEDEGGGREPAGVTGPAGGDESLPRERPGGSARGTTSELDR
jgi:hypothetical protein